MINGITYPQIFLQTSLTISFQGVVVKEFFSSTKANSVLNYYKLYFRDEVLVICALQMEPYPFV